MEKKELLEVIESYKKKLGSMDHFMDELYNGKVIWFIKTDAGPVENYDNYKELYPIGTIMPCSGHISPDDVGTWGILGITKAGKLVYFKGEQK